MSKYYFEAKIYKKFILLKWNKGKIISAYSIIWHDNSQKLKTTSMTSRELKNHKVNLKVPSTNPNTR